MLLRVRSTQAHRHGRRRNVLSPVWIFPLRNVPVAITTDSRRKSPRVLQLDASNPIVFNN